jgi:hypothetical protein
MCTTYYIQNRHEMVYDNVFSVLREMYFILLTETNSTTKTLYITAAIVLRTTKGKTLRAMEHGTALVVMIRPRIREKVT